MAGRTLEVGMHATTVLQSILAATSPTPAEEGVIAYLLAAAAWFIALILSPAWLWALYWLITGAVHCFVGYRYLTFCVVTDMIAIGCGILLFMTMPGVIGSGLELYLLTGAVIILAVIWYSKKYYPAFLGFGWGAALGAIAIWAIGIKPSLILCLPFGIFGALFAWKRRRIAYIWMCATTGAKLLEWAITVLVLTFIYGPFSILGWAFGVCGPDGGHVPGRYDSSDPVGIWALVGYVVVAAIGLVIQFKYADRWDYGKARLPDKSKAVPDDEIPSIHPGADTESHAGYGYVARPDGSGAETPDTATEEDKTGSD